MRIVRPAAVGIAAGLLLIGVGACGLAARHSAPPVLPAPTTPLGKPTVSAPAGAPGAGPVSPATPPSASGAAPGVLKSSYGGSQAQGETQVALPVWLTIPDLNVNKAKVIGLGLSDGQYPASADLPKGSIDTSPLNSAPGEAGWYDQGARPGALGPAIIAGHINYTVGNTVEQGVFEHLPDMRPGELIYVGRADGSVVTFKVTKVGTTPKAQFPTASVYGPTGDSELRLIGCSGDYDTATGHYLDNTIVYATAVT